MALLFQERQKTKRASANYAAGPSILPMARLLAKRTVENKKGGFGMATKQKQKGKKQKVVEDKKGFS